MAETRTYAMTGEATLAELGASLEKYLSETKNLRTQKFDMDNRVVLQCAGDDAQWKKFIGMDAAITAELKAEGDVPTVTIGNAKWYDKMGVAAVGAIFFTPLLLTAGLGALRQTALPEEIYDFIEGKLLNRGSTYSVGSVLVCPHCGKPYHVGDTFCSGCGRKISE